MLFENCTAFVQFCIEVYCSVQLYPTVYPVFWRVGLRRESQLISGTAVRVSRGRGRGGFYRGGAQRGDFNGGGRGGYEEWGKRPGDDLDGPPSRMRKMDTRYTQRLEQHSIPVATINDCTK